MREARSADSVVKFKNLVGSTGKRISEHRPYSSPRLMVIANSEVLLDTLGPAQAGYGSNGFR